MSLKIEDLYLPDRKRLGTLWAGTSGSGKTTAVISTLRQAILSPKFGEFHRFIIVDPKVQNGDYDLLVDPITDIDKVFKSMDKERVTLYWPYYEEFDTKTIENDISLIVDEMFKLADSEPRATFTFILDESSIVITPTRVPPSLKRLAVQGRAKGIIPSFISQRPLTNRWLDANLSNVLLFRMLPVDSDNLSKRWGLNFEESDAKIREKPYSFLRFSLEDISITQINPVELPKRIPRKKKKNNFQKMIDKYGF
tara:strand:+ start:290 stop:1048 length:759 start_codon:yes stop_codon:yes gene_type:complete